MDAKVSVSMPKNSRSVSNVDISGSSKVLPGESMPEHPPSQLNNWTFRRVVWATLVLVFVALGFWLLYRFNQVVFILFIAIVMGTVFRPVVTWLHQRGLPPIVGVILVYLLLLALLLIGIGMSAIFVAIALKSMRWETHTVLMNLITMPILFASNALLPADAMPEWLQIVTRINPITYTNDAVRQLLLVPTSSWQLVIDFVFLAIFALVCTAVGIALSWRYLAE